MAHSSPLHAHDLGVQLTIKPLQSVVRWLGTRAQLEAEGFIPADTEWPTGRKQTRIETPANLFCIYAHSAPNTQGPDAVYKIHQYSRQPDDYRQRMIDIKVKELAELLKHGTPRWAAEWNVYYKAQGDEGFQTFKRTLLGQKKRGRKPSTKITVKGATA